jgi:antirestriction protein ArdC
MSKNVYEIVTQQITDLLEAGEIPWKKPWRSTGGARNLVSKKQYRGINQFLLACSPYCSPYWLSFKQVSEKGGRVRRGEKSTAVVLWKWLEKKGESEDGGSSASPDSPASGKIPLLRYYRVFNLEQTEGIPHPPEEVISNPFTPIEQAEQVIEQMPLKPRIHFGGDSAAYSPMLDYVTLPPKEAFHYSEEFYSTAFHELAHATGHQGRVGRKGILEPSYFGSHIYSQEELVAEFCASMLCGVTGIEQSTIENSAAYIQGWLKVLKSDKKILVHAAAQAQKAADYILRSNPTEDQ